MINLVEELVLLTIKDDGSVAFTAGTPGFRFSIVGACLIELNELGRVDVDLEAVHVLSTEPTGHPALDLVLATVAEGPEQSAASWIRHLRASSGDIIGAAMRSLIERGILEQQESRILWVLKTRRYPMIDGKEQTEAKLRIVNQLLGEDIPSPHDSVLIGLADVGGLLQGFLSGREIARLEDRLLEIGNLDLIARAVEQAIRDEAEVIAQTTLMQSF